MTGPQETPIDRAKRLGTYGKIDRSKQYEGQRYSPELLLKNDDRLFAKVRGLENLKFWHRLLLIGVAATVARIPEICSFVVKFFQ